MNIHQIEREPKIMDHNKRGNGDQNLQFASKDFKGRVSKKLGAYHLFMNLGFIAQGLMQYLSIHCHQNVWANFRSWLRTIRTNALPSERVVSISMGKTYFEFLADETKGAIFKKSLRNKIDISQLQPSVLIQRDAA